MWPEPRVEWEELGELAVQMWRLGGSVYATELRKLHTGCPAPFTAKGLL